MFSTPFFSNLFATAQQVLILYILIAVGFFADKAGIYTEKASRLNTDLLFYIVTPLVIVNSFVSMDNSPEHIKGLGLAILLGFLIHLVGLILTLPIFRKGDIRQCGIYRFACMYCNCGYMALPLAQAVLGDIGVFYCSAVVMVFNVVSFTHGVTIMGAQKNGFQLKKLLINPGTIGVAIGLPLFLLKVKLPTLIASPVSSLAALNTPLAMLIFGTYLANTDLKTMFKDKNIYLVSFIKLVLIPLIMFGILTVTKVSYELRVAMTLASAAPSANNTVVFAGKYDLDTGTASKTVGLVSFLSILTMPIMIALAQM
ncbi:MAG TPA: hypothetical protein DDY98_07405 [Ruminococcaceae bacterium]|nr:hypothetical protein [Oscillospiraceae bacterium]